MIHITIQVRSDGRRHSPVHAQARLGYMYPVSSMLHIEKERQNGPTSGFESRDIGRYHFFNGTDPSKLHYARNI